jgi:hypothetical protein
MLMVPVVTGNHPCVPISVHLHFAGRVVEADHF